MSADLFAAFNDAAIPPSSQAQPKPPPSTGTRPASTPFAFASLASPIPPATTSNQPWGNVPPVSTANPLRQSWNIPPSPVPSPRPAASGPASTLPIGRHDTDDDAEDDGWGDFEVAPDTIPSPAPVLSQVAPRAPTPAKGHVKRPSEIIRASTMDLISNNLAAVQNPSIDPGPSTKSPAPLVNPSPSPSPYALRTKTSNVDPNVLFDADDFDGEQEAEGSDDDFGEFETVPEPTQPPPDLLSSGPSVQPPQTDTVQRASKLLLDLNMNEPTPEPAQVNPVPVEPAIRKQGIATSKPSLAKSAATHTRTRSTFEDDWDSFSITSDQPIQPQKLTVQSTWDWDSIESPTLARPKDPVKKPAPLRSKEVAASTDDDTTWDWDPVDTKTDSIAQVDDGALPPVNIPPPSILLSAFPQLFDQAHEYLYQPVSGQSQSIKDRILSDPRVYDYLEGYLSLAVVAARIIAGRRLRWHRDKFLSQSMSISAAGSKGMKLAGVDKSQTVREDREAADVVSNWKSQIGRLRSMVTSANSAKKGGGKQLKVPEIADTMQAQTAKDVPTAPKACAICGLKRNERLARIDYEVEDSFGEWWIEHWGHVACKRFWLQHETTLRQR
ncbi:hypothetical protein F4808DRAFT_460772 [Astrocystis sublimbata]|nr:hypothetical protein F4808DRAFT_460772 [Astrocystis sublimbata]